MSLNLAFRDSFYYFATEDQFKNEITIKTDTDNVIFKISYLSTKQGESVLKTKLVINWGDNTESEYDSKNGMFKGIEHKYEKNGTYLIQFSNKVTIIAINRIFLDSNPNYSLKIDSLRPKVCVFEDGCFKDISITGNITLPPAIERIGYLAFDNISNEEINIKFNGLTESEIKQLENFSIWCENDNAFKINFIDKDNNTFKYTMPVILNDDNLKYCNDYITKITYKDSKDKDVEREVRKIFQTDDNVKFGVIAYQTPQQRLKYDPYEWVLSKGDNLYKKIKVLMSKCNTPYVISNISSEDFSFTNNNSYYDINSESYATVKVRAHNRNYVGNFYFECDNNKVECVRTSEDELQWGCKYVFEGNEFDIFISLDIIEIDNNYNVIYNVSSSELGGYSFTGTSSDFVSPTTFTISGSNKEFKIIPNLLVSDIMSPYTGISVSSIDNTDTYSATIGMLVKSGDGIGLFNNNAKLSQLKIYSGCDPDYIRDERWKYFIAFGILTFADNVPIDSGENFLKPYGILQNITDGEESVGLYSIKDNSEKITITFDISGDVSEDVSNKNHAIVLSLDGNIDKSCSFKLCDSEINIEPVIDFRFVTNYNNSVVIAKDKVFVSFKFMLGGKKIGETNKININDNTDVSATLTISGAEKKITLKLRDNNQTLWKEYNDGIRLIYKKVSGYFTLGYFKPYSISRNYETFNNTNSLKIYNFNNATVPHIENKPKSGYMFCVIPLSGTSNDFESDTYAGTATHYYYEKNNIFATNFFVPINRGSEHNTPEIVGKTIPLRAYNSVSHDIKIPKNLSLLQAFTHQGLQSNNTQAIYEILTYIPPSEIIEEKS